MLEEEFKGELETESSDQILLSIPMWTTGKSNKFFVSCKISEIFYEYGLRVMKPQI
jgi:hypothetical protein